MKPRRYTVSMLRSHREEVRRVMRQEAEKSTAMVESAATSVLAARLQYLEAGLASDWQLAEQMKGALSSMQDEQHLWSQKWIREQDRNTCAPSMLHKTTLRADASVSAMQGNDS